MRDARDDDHAEFVRLFAELGVHEPAPSAERWAADIRARAFVLEADGDASGRLAAYAFANVAGDEMYVANVVVDPAWRGRGVGRVVMDELGRRARAKGCARWRLNVRADNAPALRLYRGVGLEVKYATQLLRLAWDRVDALDASRALGVTARAVADAAEAAQIERAFDLFDTSLSGAMNGHRHVIALVAADGACQGIARFDPGFPGAMPFRVRSPSYVRVLLEALRAHRHAEPSWLQLSIDDDVALADVLVAACAGLHLELLHMRGVVPA